MVCKNCGAECNNNEKYCSICGALLENEAQDVNYGYSSNMNNNQEPYSYQAQQQQYYYQQHVEQPNNSVDEHMTVGGWLGRLCINLIPFVGPLIYFIMLFVWAFGYNPKKSLKTFAQAQLILMAIGAVIAIIIVILAFVFVGYTASNYSNYHYYHSW